MLYKYTRTFKNKTIFTVILCFHKYTYYTIIISRYYTFVLYVSHIIRVLYIQNV